MEKSQNIYETSELQEYDERTNYQPQPLISPTGKHTESKIQIGKMGGMCLLVAAFVITITLLIILGLIIGLMLSDRGSSNECPSTTPIVSTSTGGDTNCTIVYNTMTDEVIRNNTIVQTQRLLGIINSLSNLMDTSTSSAGVIDDLYLLSKELLELHNGTFVLPTSCQEIKEDKPHSPSGVYLLGGPNGDAFHTYCNMNGLCGEGGGWTRLAYLDMSDATQNCPTGFRLYNLGGGVRACGRPASNTGSCQSVTFSSHDISYSQICGRVIGYSYNTPDAVFPGGGHNNLNSYYVDGVSITRGSPRQHVWTFIASGATSLFAGGAFHCPCFNGSIQQTQSFVGDDYFCEGGSQDPLWDGQGCAPLAAACCSVPGIPWFHRDYGNTTTTDFLELRVCGDQNTADEDVPVGYYEIYVK